MDKDRINEDEWARAWRLEVDKTRLRAAVLPPVRRLTGLHPVTAPKHGGKP